MARLQSFDDSFVFQGKRTTGGEMRKFETPQYTMVGNAVPPLLARAIGNVILENIDMRTLTELEEMNTEYLYKQGIQYVLVCLTQNILHHGIFDAKVALRELLQNTGVHDYSTQRHGERVSIKTRIMTFNKDIEASSSMYRAGTRGDARMWLGVKYIMLLNPTIYSLSYPKTG